ncbi:MAG: C39 family peptidase [Synechococcales cyanobacterium T60_A2020_003]|nr:C39 family peptidase [Synechococcales cyanobacterium T60_A2020_003]
MWKHVPPLRGSITLPVPFYLQTDNRYEPMRTCNTSSCAMVARFLGASITTDDEYYQIVRQYGDTTDHGAQTQALNHIGIRSTWHTNLGFEQLDQSLEAGLPIVIGILHRGSLQSPTGGHMVVVIGRTESRDYICHDPFGSLLDPGGGYTGDPRNGKQVIYPRYVLTHRWTPDGDQSGWGRLFYGNR